MRVITVNVNGIRSAARRGLLPWLARQDADVICLQEIRAQEQDLQGEQYALPGYRRELYPAQRPGYAGTAVFSRLEPERVVRGFGVPEFDAEGRYLELRYGKLSVVSLYLPSGSAGPPRQASKFRFLDAFMPHLKR
ncbi:MAG TPA: exodeoxyribonuclease III, partial [Steroidobacteraceae bacterium]|nr:exodeoxyribonuclease III [Steroidobacteraceae bacterium]